MQNGVPGLRSGPGAALSDHREDDDGCEEFDGGEHCQVQESLVFVWRFKLGEPEVLRESSQAFIPFPWILV